MSQAEREAKYISDAVAKALPYFTKMESGEIDGVSTREITQDGNPFCCLFAHQYAGDPGIYVCIVPLRLAEQLNEGIAEALRIRGHEADGLTHNYPVH